MKFKISKAQLQEPLSLVSGACEKRSAHHAVLSNVLLDVRESQLVLKGTDTELELSGTIDEVDVEVPGCVTVSVQKLVDVCHALPTDQVVSFVLDDKQNLKISAGKVRFSLMTLPADSFPSFEQENAQFDCSVDSQVLSQLISRTHFSMGVQDVRFFLNGLLLELSSKGLKCVSSDGHRISMAVADFSEVCEQVVDRQLVIPRKGVYELQKLLNSTKDSVQLSCLDNSLQVSLPKFRYLTKLIDGQFPDYQQVFSVNYDKSFVADVGVLKSALSRVAILSNDRYRTIVIQLSAGQLFVQAHNPSQEESHDELAIEYDGPEIELGFNVDYLLDVLNVLKTEQVRFSFIGEKKSVLVEGVGDGEDGGRYMVMPRSI